MISIIIPTFNEADQIAQTIGKTQTARGEYPIEIIIVDGGSTDDTVNIAKKSGATTVLSKKKGRAAQMNIGAAISKGEILYFLHADSIPPNNFTSYITQAFKGKSIGGCFMLEFDHKHWFLKANCWFTRFNINAFRFGDQSLYVSKDVFQQTHGFREDLLMMEDQEIIHRIKRHGKFEVMNAAVTTSARKYLENGIYRMQCIFFLIWLLFYLGYSQEKLLMLYRKFIRQNKL